MHQRTTGLNDETNTSTPEVRPAAETVRPAPATIDLQALKNSLTMAQRNGRACIVCGGSDYPLKPAGKLGDVALVECDTHKFQRQQDADKPSWLLACPAWCVEDHHGHDDPDDRNHWSAWRTTDLHTMKYEDCGAPDQPDYRPHTASAALLQHYREAEPRISLGDDAAGTWSLHMSLDEAEQVAHDLLELIHQARAASE